MKRRPLAAHPNQVAPLYGMSRAQAYLEAKKPGGGAFKAQRIGGNVFVPLVIVAEHLHVSVEELQDLIFGPEQT